MFKNTSIFVTFLASHLLYFQFLKMGDRTNNTWFPLCKDNNKYHRLPPPAAFIIFIAVPRLHAEPGSFLKYQTDSRLIHEQTMPTPAPGVAA